MKNNFRLNHILRIFEAFTQDSLPLDRFLNVYFRTNKALGSHDRREIAETVYNLVRWQGLVDFLIDPPLSWQKRLNVFSQLDIETHSKNKTIPPHTRVSFPKIVWDLLVENWGATKAEQICLTSNTQAPITIRANALKTSRDDLLKKLQKNARCRPCKDSQNGITLEDKIQFFSLPEFKEGLFEVQDEGSQLVAYHVSAKPGDHVLDYCAGSGGKTLAFAPLMKGQGQIYLHDIRRSVLHEARKRLKRAGIQNVQIIEDLKQKAAILKHRMDWVLTDVPCSGSGTWRRNPDMKWKFEQAMLDRLVQEQRQIVSNALQYLKPNGRLVYATCSLFQEENQKQIEFFTRNYGLTLEKEPFSCFPEKGEKDGFFAAILKKVPVGVKSQHE